MSDWEDELENDKKKREEDFGKVRYEDESEEIIKKPIKVKEENTIDKKEEKKDYEKLYNERHKDIIDKRNVINKALQGIKNEDLRSKKEKEFQDINMAEKFMGQTKEEEIVLNLEKDFIELAKQISGKINVSNLSTKFTYTYLKNVIQLLCGNLDSENINEVIKVLKFISNNKKLKEEGNNKKDENNNKKPVKYERSENIGIMNDLGADNTNNDKKNKVEDDDDDFM